MSDNILEFSSATNVKYIGDDSGRFVQVFLSNLDPNARKNTVVTTPKPDLVVLNGYVETLAGTKHWSAEISADYQKLRISISTKSTSGKVSSGTHPLSDAEKWLKSHAKQLRLHLTESEEAPEHEMLEFLGAAVAAARTVMGGSKSGASRGKSGTFEEWLAKVRKHGAKVSNVAMAERLYSLGWPPEKAAEELGGRKDESVLSEELTWREQGENIWGAPAKLGGATIAIRIDGRSGKFQLSYKELGVSGGWKAAGRKMHPTLDAAKQAAEKWLYNVGRGKVESASHDLMDDVRQILEGATPGARSKGTGHGRGETSASGEFWSGKYDKMDAQSGRKKRFNKAQRQGEKKHIDAQMKGESVLPSPFYYGINETTIMKVSRVDDETYAEKADDPKTIATLRNIVRSGSAAKVGGVLVDQFSASAAVQVYDHLSPENRAKMAALPIRKMMDVVFKMVAKRQA